jgi:hypothetical protein
MQSDQSRHVTKKIAMVKYTFCPGSNSCFKETSTVTIELLFSILTAHDWAAYIPGI